jgi:cytochrome b561-like protein
MSRDVLQDPVDEDHLQDPVDEDQDRGPLTQPCLIAMPLLGWGMLSAAAYPVVLFGGWHLPAILPQSDSVHTLLWDAHFYLAFAFFALILLHVAAALFHALVRRDGVCADQRDEIAAVRPRAHSITSSAEQRRWYFDLTDRR